MKSYVRSSDLTSGSCLMSECKKCKRKQVAVCLGGFCMECNHRYGHDELCKKDINDE